MKLLLALPVLLGLICAQAAWAADWVALPAAGTADQYSYDRSKLTIKDEEITYWKKVVFQSVQPIHGREAASGLLRERIHCAEHTAKLVSYLYYSATGETIDYVAQDDSEPAPIIPDTVGDAFERVLCPLVWHKQEETRLKAEQKAAAAELAASRKEEKKPEARSQPKLDPKAVKVVPAPTVTVAPTTTNLAPQSVEKAAPQPTQPVAPLPMPQIIEQLY